MAKKTIRLTESELITMIEGIVKEVKTAKLNESRAKAARVAARRK